jgi:hypothetical protein
MASIYSYFLSGMGTCSGEANDQGGYMAEVQDRNARCHCGSGKKYKNCHGVEASALRRRIPGYFWLIGAVAVVIAVFALMNRSERPSNRVWSEEHGHWHDAP